MVSASALPIGYRSRGGTIRRGLQEVVVGAGDQESRALPHVGGKRTGLPDGPVEVDAHHDDDPRPHIVGDLSSLTPTVVRGDGRTIESSVVRPAWV